MSATASMNGAGAPGVHDDPDNDWSNVEAWERERRDGIETERARQRQRAQMERTTSGAADATELRDLLTVKLGLRPCGLEVTGAQIFGRGPKALVDIYLLGNDRPLRFESFADVAKPETLAAHLVTQTGVPMTFKGADAKAVAAMIFRLAQHHIEADADDTAREWGGEYLRLAAKEHVDLSDQADRWRAFSALERVSPVRQAGEDRSGDAVAAASLVLVGRETGDLVARTGWFHAYVSRQPGGMFAPAALIALMQRVGWTRPNSQGRIKASCPSGDRRPLSWPFYIVPAGWS